ncbi:MAG: hypothetical protein K0Q72_1736 [Armatimonadetes bacterium]|jgi:hypothetical protein|nr:hypothetical protein [Armatimonadota bacterium]
MSEDRGFEINDRRQYGPANGNGHGDGPHDEPEADEPDEATGPLEVTVQGVLRFAIEMLSNHAWVSMGLMANPMNGKIQKDLPEAKRAIDILGDLARHAEAGAEPDEKRDLRNMLADLRVNFLRQSGS